MGAQQQGRIRILADRYDAVMGGNVYAGRENGTGRRGHYFSTGFIVGDDQALAHMLILCQRAGIPVDGAEMGV